jgi:hypothetical protein
MSADVDLKGEAPRFKRRNISATIAAKVKRFCHRIKTNELFGTHNRVSTDRQGCSRLGLSAQREVVLRHMTGAGDE